AAGRCRCTAWLGGSSSSCPLGGGGRGGATSIARQSHAAAGASGEAAHADRRRGPAGRLRDAGHHLGTTSAGAAARATASPPLSKFERSGECSIGTPHHRGGTGGRSPTAADRQRRHLRHAGRRTWHDQCGGLATV